MARGWRSELDELRFRRRRWARDGWNFRRSGSDWRLGLRSAKD